MSLLIGSIAVVVVVWGQGKKDIVAPIVMALAIVIVIITPLSISRMFQAYVERARTKKNLEDLREYLTSNYSGIKKLLSEQLSFDDWLTSEKRNWWLKSLTLKEWFFLVLLTGFFAGVAGYSFFVFLQLKDIISEGAYSLIIGIIVGVVVSSLYVVVLARKIKEIRKRYGPK